MKPAAAIVLLISCLALPDTGRSEDSNQTSDLFGITVTQTGSEAEQFFRLGNAYYEGDGKEQDQAKAIEYFKKAAELGHGLAQYNLAVCYLHDNSMKQNTKKAAEWLKKAAAQDVKDSHYLLGLCHYKLEQYPEAYAEALFAKDSGDARLKDMLDLTLSENKIAAGKARFEELKNANGQQKKK